MRKNKFSEFQLVRILKAVEGGIAVKDICLEHESCCAILQWKSGYGGIETPDVRRMRELEDENNNPEQMGANLSPEAVAAHGLSLRGCCKAYKSAHRDDRKVIRAMYELAAAVFFLSKNGSVLLR
ncbi:MAG: transposase [Desulfovibrio sp.]|jgi:putative transposase|nr:transposase [Desulfovibrio sp.]